MTDRRSATRRLASGVGSLLRLELQMSAGLLRLLGRRADVPDASTPVRYVGAVAALLWGLTAVSAVELVVLHLVIPWETVRLVSDVVGVWGLWWCAGFTACHYVYPHLVDGAGIRLRAARRRPALLLTWAQVAAATTAERSRDGSRSVQVEDGVLHLPVGGRTNVTLRLRQPTAVEVRGTPHEVGEVRFFADEPSVPVAAFRAAVAAG